MTTRGLHQENRRRISFAGDSCLSVYGGASAPPPYPMGAINPSEGLRTMDPRGERPLIYDSGLAGAICCDPRNPGYACPHKPSRNR